MNILNYLLIFPGFLLLAFVIGLVASYIERKVTARVQWRVGPPVLQPLYDVLKLFSKENVIPHNAHFITFITAPVLSFVCAALVATFIGLSILMPSATFQGDIIVVVYLLTAIPVCLILGGAASGNPLASLGASREMKLVMSYELLFWVLIAIAWIKTGGILNISEFSTKTPVLFSFSGAIAFVLSLFVLQAKLGRIPFDVAEAETEIMAGPYIEYSGPLLGFFKITHYILLSVLPMFIASIFLGGINIILSYVVLLVIVILVENTNPRLKIGQCVKLFWFILFPISLVALVLALVGL